MRTMTGRTFTSSVAFSAINTCTPHRSIPTGLSMLNGLKSTDFSHTLFKWDCAFSNISWISTCLSLSRSLTFLMLIRNLSGSKKVDIIFKAGKVLPLTRLNGIEGADGSLFTDKHQVQVDGIGGGCISSLTSLEVVFQKNAV